MTTGRGKLIARRASGPTALIPVPSANLNATPGNGAVALSATYTGPPGFFSFSFYQYIANTWTLLITQSSGSYNVTGLTNGTSYSFQVVVTTAESPPRMSAPTQASATPQGSVPAQVTGLAITGQTSTSISLSWSAASRATAYTVERNGSVVATGVTSLSYTDTPLTPSTTYTYQVFGTNSAGGGPLSAAVQGTTTSTASSYANYLPYLQSLGTSSGKVGLVCGQHLNEFPQSTSESPDDVFVGTSPNFTVAGTTLCPGAVAMNVQGPNNGGVATQQTLPSPIDFVTIASQHLNAGRILQVSAFFNNPANANAGGSWLTNPALGDAGVGTGSAYPNPFPNILTSGTTTYNNFVANLTQIGTLLLKLNQATGSKPFIFRHGHECTLGAPSAGGWWWAFGGGGYATGAQFKQWWLFVRNFLWNFTSSSYPGLTLHNLYFQFNTNAGSDGSAGYPDTSGAAYVRGTSMVDVIGIDAYPPSSGDTGVWNSFVAMAPGRVCVYGEAGVDTFTQPPTFSFNNYTNLMQIVANDCHQVGIVFIMCQNWQLALQNGATAAMSTSPIINSSTLPSNLYS